MVIHCPHCRRVLTKSEIKNHRCPECNTEIKITSTTSVQRHGTTSIPREIANQYFSDSHILDDDGEKPITQEYPQLNVNTNPRNFSILLKGTNICTKIAPDESIDYEISETIGSGGMGIILKAKQKAIGRDVAIKLADTSNKLTIENTQKLCTEAAITGRLEHPNIIPIYDLGLNEEKNVFYAMKLVDGTPWCDIIDANSLQENIEILLAVCNGIAYAHSQGIIHRDLKPDNVMIGKYSEVLVTDWGLAAGISDDSFAPRVSYEDAIAGTPAYMSPEMALGYEEKIDHTSDIYLLGAILFEVLTGQVPHTGESIIQCISNAGKNVIEEPWIKSELLKTAMKAMSTDQSERYQSVEEFRDAISTHYESVRLSTKAKKILAQGKISRDFGEILKAIIYFQTSLEKWCDNEEAKKNLESAVNFLADCAKDQGDEKFIQKIASMLI